MTENYILNILKMLAIFGCSSCRLVYFLFKCCAAWIFHCSCVGAMSMNPLTKDELVHAIPGTLTISYRLGDAVLRARRESRDPVEAILEAANGVLVVQGKVSCRMVMIDYYWTLLKRFP